jgi:hypothetical protein
MNTKIFFIILLVLAGAIIFGISAKQRREISATVSVKTETGSQTSSLTPQAKTMGAVEVEIKPVSVAPGQEAVFEISMDTHSVELNYDYTQIATLSGDKGNSYKPITWTGGNSGHHLSGQLIFAPLNGNPKKLTLTLEGIDNETGDFSWEL